MSEHEYRGSDGEGRAERERREDYRGRGPRNYERSSERIWEDVAEALTDDRDVDASSMEVEAEDDGVVTLRGTVADRDQKRRAEDVAVQVRGVRDVRNLLELGDRDLADDLAGRASASGSERLGEYRDPEWGEIDLRGFGVEARDGSIGSVDDRSLVGGDHVIVDTGPWIFGKEVVLPVGLIEHIDFQERRLHVSASKDTIKNAPEFSEERLDDPTYGAELRSYYGSEHVEAGERR